MIPFTSTLKDITNIQLRNKAFDKLYNADKRKEICLDAISLVLSGVVGASHGRYWGSSLNTIYEPDAEVFQDTLVNKLPNCQVCQRGLLMLSQIRLGNSIPSTEMFCESGHEDIIKGFTMKDFESMELEFEWNGVKISLATESVPSHMPFEINSREKLINICCNVLANGNYNTEDHTDYLALWEIELPEIVNA